MIEDSRLWSRQMRSVYLILIDKKCMNRKKKALCRNLGDEEKRKSQ